MDEKEETREELTNDEETIEHDDDVSREEAHRIGEFRELRDMLEGIRVTVDEVKSLATDINAGFGMFVENGATIREADIEPTQDAVEFDEEGNLTEFVYDLEDIDLNM